MLNIIIEKNMIASDVKDGDLKLLFTFQHNICIIWIKKSVQEK